MIKTLKDAGAISPQLSVTNVSFASLISLLLSVPMSEHMGIEQQYFMTIATPAFAWLLPNKLPWKK